MTGNRRTLWGCVLSAALLAGLPAVWNGAGENGQKPDKVREASRADTEEAFVPEEEKEASEVQWEKGYDLPVEEGEKEEAESDCRAVMERIREIYEQADKGGASNVILSDETVLRMQKKAGESGVPVAAAVLYSDLENYEDMEKFIRECTEGKSGSIVVYKIRLDGGVGRMKFIFDKTDLYVLDASAVWNKEKEPQIAYVSYTRINRWRYSEKGWFCYKMCVPEYPEVTEAVDGSCLLRVKPMEEEMRELSQKCVRIPGYRGNNLLCSDWDAEHLDALDYNGLFEYFYEMKYQKKVPSEAYPNGIPRDEFESLIMEFLPASAGQIREYAVFDEEDQAYVWVPSNCFNAAPTIFGTSIPEVVAGRENADGTVTLTVDAVCEIMLCDDAVISHELTLRFAEDGSFRYLGNRILYDGTRNVPDYRYRVSGCEYFN